MGAVGETPSRAQAAVRAIPTPEIRSFMGRGGPRVWLGGGRPKLRRGNKKREKTPTPRARCGGNGNINFGPAGTAGGGCALAQ